jgi:hypothetical protein
MLKDLYKRREKRDWGTEIDDFGPQNWDRGRIRDEEPLPNSATAFIS